MTKISRRMVYFQPKIVNYLWVLSHFVTVCLELSLNIKVLFTLLFLPLYHSLLRSLENSRVKHVSQFSDETWRKESQRRCWIIQPRRIALCSKLGPSMRWSTTTLLVYFLSFCFCSFICHPSGFAHRANHMSYAFKTSIQIDVNK